VCHFGARAQSSKYNVPKLAPLADVKVIHLDKYDFLVRFLLRKFVKSHLLKIQGELLRMHYHTQLFLMYLLKKIFWWKSVKIITQE